MSVGAPGQPTLLDYVQEHLIAVGICRKPRTAGAGHPAYKQPKTGTPAPGDAKGPEADSDVVVGLFRQPGVASSPYESWFRRDCVEVVYRLRAAHDMDALEYRVRGELADRRAWTTRVATLSAGLYVIESLVWRELAPLGSDEKVVTFNQQFMFQVYTGQGPR